MEGEDGYRRYGQMWNGGSGAEKPRTPNVILSKRSTQTTLLALGQNSGANLLEPGQIAPTLTSIINFVIF
jgi:hypothetical protein